MARSALQKSHHLDDSVLAGAARLRARVLALVHGALRESGLDQVKLARRLGLRKAAVNALLRGNGNVRVNSLAEYMGVMGYEIDIVAVPLGEVEAAMLERRAPHHCVLTMADQDRRRPLFDDVIAVYTAEMTGTHSTRALEHARTDSHNFDHAYMENLKTAYTRRLEGAR